MRTQSVHLGQVATIIQGGRHRLSGNHFVKPQSGYPAFGAGGLNGYLPTFEFEEAAVVLSSIGARCGKCFLATGRWTSLANTQVILPDPARADVRYLWYQLNDESSWLRSGTAQPFIKPSTVKAREVFLPALNEQRRIADILDKADAIRRKRKEAIALTEELLRSVFLDMFGDPVTNPKGWSVRPLRDVTVNYDARRVPLKQSDRDMRHGEYPYYGASGVIDYLDDYLFEGEYLLIGEDGANLLTRTKPIGFIASGRFWVNNHAHVVTATGGLSLAYLVHLLHWINLAPYVTGSAQPKLNLTNFERIPIPVPPQARVAEFGELEHRIEHVLAGQRVAGFEAEGLYSGLVARFFAQHASCTAIPSERLQGGDE